MSKIKHRADHLLGNAIMIAQPSRFGKYRSYWYNHRMNDRNLLFSPSLLGGNYSRAKEEADVISQSGADYIHLDVMDGHFVPEITFGAKFIRDLRPETDLVFDVHMMVERPEDMIPGIAEAGAGIITVHYEATDHIYRCIDMIRESGAEAGVAICPGTPVSALEPLLGTVDYILVMTVNPGWGGQRFIPAMVRKVKELDRLRDEEGYAYRIEADGGISMENIGLLYKAGLDIAAIGTSFFRAADKVSFLEDMLGRAEGTL